MKECFFIFKKIRTNTSVVFKKIYDTSFNLMPNNTPTIVKNNSFQIDIIDPLNDNFVSPTSKYKDSISKEEQILKEFDENPLQINIQTQYGNFKVTLAKYCPQISTAVPDSYTDGKIQITFANI